MHVGKYIVDQASTESIADQDNRTRHKRQRDQGGI